MPSTRGTRGKSMKSRKHAERQDGVVDRKGRRCQRDAREIADDYDSFFLSPHRYPYFNNNANYIKMNNTGFAQPSEVEDPANYAFDVGSPKQNDPWPLMSTPIKKSTNRLNMTFRGVNPRTKLFPKNIKKYDYIFDDLPERSMGDPDPFGLMPDLPQPIYSPRHKKLRHPNDTLFLEDLGPSDSVSGLSDNAPANLSTLVIEFKPPRRSPRALLAEDLGIPYRPMDHPDPFDLIPELQQSMARPRSPERKVSKFMRRFLPSRFFDR